ncbi:MAG TPA: TonB-dependent receptor [Erythrobacter sp.]|nr:TonB-dependent receptor [Erythrobacter sp.]
MSSKRIRHDLILVSGLAIVLAAPAHAQDQQTSSDQASSTGTEAEQAGVGDIIVTAQKRSQSINSVGMAISALSGDDLKAQGISDVSDLARVVPGFTFAQSQKGAPIYTLRGVGFFEESLGASPAVSIYVDEAGYAFPIMAKAASLDIERVEVLKGPQGTLFGQNSTGGAIYYIAAKPTSIFSAGMDASFGRFGRTTLEGHVSGPLTDTLVMRIAAATEQGGAWQKSASRGERNGAADILKGRLLIDWKPTDTLTIGLNVNGWRDRGDTIAASLLAVTPQSPGRTTAALLAQTPVRERPGLADWNADADLHTDQNFYQGVLRADLELADALTLTSLSSLSHFDQDDFRDTDGSPSKVFGVRQEGRIKSFSQELRASGKLIDNRLYYVVGGFYANDRTSEQNTFDLQLSTSVSAFNGLGFPSFIGTRAVTEQQTKTKALFANLDFDINDALTFHAGARRTWSDTDFSGCMQDRDGNYASGITVITRRLNPSAPAAQPQGCVTFMPDATAGRPFVGSLDQSNTSWRVGLDWKPMRGTLLYATLSKGYKSGSFPNINATTFASFQPVTQESVLAYELGFKTDLGSRAIQLNGAVFYYDYRDKQFRARIVDAVGVFGAVEALVNVPKSRVKGAELSATLQPLDGLRINAGVTYLDTEVTKDFFNFDPFGARANFKGEAFPFTPKWSLQGDANYEWGISDKLNAFIGGNVSYRTSTTSAFGRYAPAPLYPYSLVEISGYALVDTQIGIAASDGQWRAALWVKNITNKYYWTDAFRQIDNTSRHVGEPRTYGVRFNYKF